MNDGEQFNTPTDTLEVQERTIFDDAIQNTEQSFNNATTRDSKVVDALDEQGTINEVMKRPTFVEDIHLSVATDPIKVEFNPGVAFTPISTLSFPKAMLDKDMNKRLKLAHYRYSHFDMVLRFETNAQPYMSGKLWIFYDVVPKLKLKSKELTYLAAPSITSYPGVVYDINAMSHAEIKIPYSDYRRVYDHESTMESIELYVVYLTKLRDVTTETNLRLRVYAWAENVTVMAPTSMQNFSLSAYSAFHQVGTREENRKMNLPSETAPTLNSPTNSARGSGIVSTISGAISVGARVACMVPSLASIAAPVGWASDIVHGVATILGVSKPHDTAPSTKILNLPGYGFTYAESTDQSLVLATRPDNELGSLKDVFPTNDDEMDLQYVCANPGVVARYAYSASNDNNKWLGTLYCTPYPKTLDFDLFDNAALPNKISAIGASPTCGEYVSQMFQLWRATICFKISVASTPFHNGRLVISFDPSNTPKATPRDVIGQTYTTILDLAENSSIIVKIPFISARDYLHTCPVKLGTMEDVSMGSLSIGPLAPLLRPTTVPDTVDVLVWKWFEDVEFAVPVSTFNMTSSTFRPKTLPEEEENDDEVTTDETDSPIKAFIQINIMNRDSEKTIVFNNPIVDTSLKHATQCIGERIVNLRPLLRMQGYDGKLSAGATRLIPFSMTDTKKYTLSTFNVKSYQMMLSLMYRFYRGGFRYKIFTKPSDKNGCISSLAYGGSAALVDNETVRPLHITYNQINPVHEISLPFYSEFYRRPIHNANDDSGKNNYRFPFVWTAVGEEAEIYRSGDDNLTYGWLVGPPSMLWLKSQHI